MYCLDTCPGILSKWVQEEGSYPISSEDVINHYDAVKAYCWEKFTSMGNTECTDNESESRWLAYLAQELNIMDFGTAKIDLQE